MRLEDTIRLRLFRIRVNDYSNENTGGFVIECKAEKNKPVPLCIPYGSFAHSDLVYRQLYLTSYPYYPAFHERSTPRAMYNLIFGSGFHNESLSRIKVKTAEYYCAPGVLFDSDKKLLFYFAKGVDSQFHPQPRLYITPHLILSASLQGKPMEKFFMSTILPFLVSTPVNRGDGVDANVIIEINNNVDEVFFMPQINMVSTYPVDRLSDKLTEILADNSDVLSRFMENYIE